MKHQRQGAFECKLTVAAMLIDVELKEVKRVACKAAGVKRWADVAYSTPKYWAGLKAVMIEWPQIRERGFLEFEYVFNVLKDKSHELQLGGEYQPMTQELLQGIGEIFIRINGCNHSIAFEHGIVYDPNEPKEWPAEVYWDIVKDRTEFWFKRERSENDD